jgi:hypothetical protein
MFRKVLVVLLPLLLLTLILTQLTSARMFRNTFHPDSAAVGEISHGGRFVDVIAEIACTPGERVRVEVTLSQGSRDFQDPDAEWSSALGHGRAQANCEGEHNTLFIPVRVVAQGRDTFVAGPATGSGLAITTHRGQRTDVRQWQPAAGITLQ